MIYDCCQLVEKAVLQAASKLSIAVLISFGSAEA